jgi:tetratricopeptide (TPR) repeat protein
MERAQELFAIPPTSSSHRSKWPHFLAAMLAGAVVVTAITFLSLEVHRTQGLSSSYHYQFERTPRGAVRQALQREIEFYQTRLSYDPGSGLNMAALAGSYVRMARATGDLRWYLLAEQAAQRSVASLPFQNNGALIALARVAEARHDFQHAIRLARQAGNAEALSIIVTSNLGMGKIDEAARAAETLVQGGPGLTSYTLRSLVEVAQGTDDAAIADLRRAIASEEPGEAATSAWARTLLGRLHYRRGRLRQAAELYREALAILPQYPQALTNLAALEIRQGKYGLAGQHLADVVTITRASPNIYDHVVLRGLARLADLRGDHTLAEALRDDAEARLRQDVTSGQFGHRRELARLLLERGRPGDAGEALALMQLEVRVRRDAETMYILAWALSRAGHLQQAQQAMQEALWTGVRDARLFYRAATIEQALGHDWQAQHFLELMRQTDPTFDDRARRVMGEGSSDLAVQ